MYDRDIQAGLVYEIAAKVSYGQYTGARPALCLRQVAKRWIFQLADGTHVQRAAKGVHGPIAVDWTDTTAQYKKAHTHNMRVMKNRRNEEAAWRNRFEVLEDTLRDVLPDDSDLHLMFDWYQDKLARVGVTLRWVPMELVEALVPLLREAKKKAEAA